MHTGLKRTISKVLLALLSLSFSSGLMDIGKAHANSKVQIKEHFTTAPQRIVVLPLFAEEILLEMISAERIVGVWHDYWEGGEVYTPTMALTKDMEHNIGIDDTERIIALNPDLVITWNSNYYLYETIIPALEQEGIAVMFVDTPHDFGDVKDTITMLGDVMGAQERAAEMIRNFNAKCEQLAQAISTIPEEERIRVTYYRQYAPAQLLNTTLAEAAGVISDGGSIFVSKPDYREIDDLLLAQWNPDLIAFAPYYTDTDGSLFGFGDDYIDKCTEGLLEKPALANTAAIQNANVHPLAIYESQYMMQSAIDLAQLAYPHLFIEESQ